MTFCSFVCLRMNMNTWFLICPYRNTATRVIFNYFYLAETSIKALIIKDFGEVAEWTNAAVLKTAVPQGTGGSNPSLSATQ